MAHNKIPVTKKQGGLGGKPKNTDCVEAVVTTGVLVVGGVQYNTPYVFNSLSNAEALGINAAYDTANSVLVWHHLSRIYKRNSKAEVHFILAPQTVTLTQLVDPAYATPYAFNLLKSANGRIKMAGIIRNPASGYTATLTGGLDADVLAAIPKAQLLYDNEADEFRYCQFIIEGRSFNGSSGSATDLRSLEAPNVSVVILQDPAVAAVNALFQGYAAVGDILGLLSYTPISQNIGENNKIFNLLDRGNGFYTTGSNLSSYTSILTYSAGDLTALNTKGYIFAEQVSPLPGFYLCDAHTCDLVESDYSYLERNRVIDKAISLARTALLPVVNARLKADTTSGQLDKAEEEGLKSVAIDSIEILETDKDISGGRACSINEDNPNYDLLAGDSLDFSLTFVPMVIGREVTLKVGFSNPKKSN